MKEGRTDLRTQKIYDALINAFSELLEEKDFEKITVKELCEKARTRTATFYNHFSDKYDFFSFMVTQLRHNYLKQSEIVYDQEHPEDYYLSFLKNAFAFVDHHQKMITHILSDQLLSLMMDSLSQEVINEFEDHLRKDLNDESINIDIAMQMLLGAMSSCVRYYLSHPSEKTKLEILTQFSKLLQKLKA